MKILVKFFIFAILMLSITINSTIAGYRMNSAHYLRVPVKEATIDTDYPFITISIPDVVIQTRVFDINLTVSNPTSYTLEIKNVTLDSTAPVELETTDIQDTIPQNTNKTYTLKAVVPIVDGTYSSISFASSIKVETNVTGSNLITGSFLLFTVRPCGSLSLEQPVISNGQLAEFNLSVFNNLQQPVVLKKIDIFPYEVFVRGINLTHLTESDLGDLNDTIPPESIINYTLKLTIVFENLTGVDKGTNHGYILYYANTTFDIGNQSITVKNYLYSTINEDQEKKVTSPYFHWLLLLMPALVYFTRKRKRGQLLGRESKKK